jgi:dCMP deaminase
LREEFKIPSGERHELCRGLHGEQNAFLQASLHGISVKDSVLYCTNQPCIICAKMIINTGIKEIVISEGYPDKMSMDFFKQAKIVVRKAKK